MNNNSRNLIWCLIIGYFVWTLLDAFFHPVSAHVSAMIRVLFVIVIAVSHAMTRYSLKQLLVFLGITFVVSNGYENLSILTGFPFGHYHYTDALGAKLFLVPLIIFPAYFGNGYMAWSLAHVLVGAFGKRLRSAQIWTVPLIAAFVMVLWDLQMDPIAATISKKWIWHDGGAYFGVPFVNFIGWLLCVYTFYQLFALYMCRQDIKSEQNGRDMTDRSYWYQPAVAFLTASLPWVTLALTADNSVVADATGKQWQTMDIYQSMALVAIFTMWFVCILSAILTGRRAQTD